MRLNFPIEIAGIIYNVMEEEYKHNDEYNLGFCNASECEISLREGLPNDRLFETFVHEMTHAMLIEAGFRYSEDDAHNEEFVERFSKTLFQVLLDNDFELIKEYFYNMKEEE